MRFMMTCRLHYLAQADQSKKHAWKMKNVVLFSLLRFVVDALIEVLTILRQSMISSWRRYPHWRWVWLKRPRAKDAKEKKQRLSKQSTINTLPIYRHDRLFVRYYWYNIYPLFRVWLASTPFGHDGHNNCIYSCISEFFGLDTCQCHDWYTFFCTQSQCGCFRCLMCLLVFHQLLEYWSKMSRKRLLLLDYI